MSGTIQTEISRRPEEMGGKILSNFPYMEIMDDFR
jgi:hypothetical protein